MKNVKFKKFFTPILDDYSEYAYQEFEVIRELTDDERDPEVGRMYKIKFNNGTVIDAWAEEIEEI